MADPNAMGQLPLPGNNQTGRGGQALPPYLQMRTPTPGQPGTLPTLTPASSGTPGEVTDRSTTSYQSPGSGAPLSPASVTQGSPGAPPVAGGATPPQLGGDDLAGQYNFYKSDLQNTTNQKLANARTDASARGVFYGTPLTGSEADINTQMLRGLGQLSAGMYGNQQQGMLTRLGLGSNLLNFGPQANPGQMDPNVWSALGGLFGQGQSVLGRSPTLANARNTAASNSQSDKANGPF